MDKLLDKAIETHGSHFDVANIIHAHYKNKYRVINDRWEMLKDEEWHYMENANELYINISIGIFDFLKEKSSDMLNRAKVASNLIDSDVLKEKSKIIDKIAINCKMVNYKQALIKECKPLFTVKMQNTTKK